MEMEEWQDCGIQFSYIGGEAYLNIYRWRARLSGFRMNIMMR